MRVVNLLDWNISTRLWMGFGVLISVLAMVVIISSFFINQADTKLEKLVDEQLVLGQTTYHIKTAADSIVWAIYDYETHQNSSSLESARKAESVLKENIEDFNALAVGSDLDPLAFELNQSCEDVTDSYLEFFMLIDEQQALLQSFREDNESVNELIHTNLIASIESTDSNATVKIEGALGMALSAMRTSNAVEVYVAEQTASMKEMIDEAKTDFHSFYDLYESAEPSAYEQSWLSKIADDFDSVYDNGIDLMTVSGTLQALRNQLEQNHNDVVSLLNNEIDPLVRGQLDGSASDSRNAMNNAIIPLIVLGIMGIIIGSSLAWITFSRFRKSIRGLQDGSKAIADGKIDYRFDVDTKDEFGRVGFALNQMLQNLGRSRAALGESEETAWALLDATTDSVILMDIRGTILASNEIAAERFEKSLEQMIDENYYDLLPADLMASRKAQIAEVIRTLKPACFEDERGGMIYDLSIFPVFDSITGKVKRIALFSRDITTRKWVEEVAEKLGRRNELILEAAGDGIYGLDIHGRTTFVNPAAARMLGYRPSDLIGERHHELVHHSRPNGMPYPSQECPIYSAFKEGAIRTSVDDEVFWRKDGTSFPVEYTSTPIMDDGKIAGAVVTFRDISERKHIETALRRTAERYRTILDSDATFIVSVDREGIIVDSNAQAKRIAGYMPDEIVGKKCIEFVHTDYQAKMDEILKEVLVHGFSYNIRFKIVRNDGTIVDVNMNAAAIKDENGEYVRTICMIDNIFPES